MMEEIAQLHEERKILGQLVVRNHNQHTSTELFGEIKALKRALMLLTEDKLQIAAKKLEDAVKASVQSKITVADVTSMLQADQMVKAVLHYVSVAMQRGLSCAAHLRRQLLRRIFLPLYSMLLAITARIFACLTAIHSKFYEDSTTLVGQLKHIKIVQPRLAKLISEYLSAHGSFSRAVEAVHTHLSGLTGDTAEETAQDSLTKGNRNTSSTSLHTTHSGGRTQRMVTAVYDDDAKDCDAFAAEAVTVESCDTPSSSAAAARRSVPPTAQASADALTPSDSRTSYDWLISESTSASAFPLPQAVNVPSKKRPVDTSDPRGIDDPQEAPAQYTDLDEARRIKKARKEAKASMAPGLVAPRQEVAETRQQEGEIENTERTHKKAKKTKAKGGTGDAIDDIFGGL